MTQLTGLGRSFTRGIAGLAAVGLLLTGCSSGSPAASAPASGAAAKFTVGFAVGGQPNADWQKLQGDVAASLAAARGWGYVQLSNDNSEATATTNADIFIQKKVNIVMTFNGQPAANPVMAKKYKDAGIPVVTFDIAQPGWYFVGVDNASAGTAGGTKLGELAKSKWNCKVDMVISAEGTSSGQINTWRTGNARDAVKTVCPDIPAAAYVSYEADGNLTTSLKNAPGVFAAHPNAKNILVVGINDQAVVGALQAATQLGRDGSIMGWGQDGGLITGKNVDPNLVGSVMYFLESYPADAFKIADQLAAGNAPAVKDTGDNAAVQIKPCPVTKDQAAAIPSIEARVTQLGAAPAGTTAYSLFCKA